MAIIGSRIREERERLGLTQASLGVAPKTQRFYEIDERQPDALYLAAFAERGADVLYIVTGRREVTADVVRNAVLSAAELLALPIDAPVLAQLVAKLCSLPQNAIGENGGLKYVITHNHGHVGDYMTNNFSAKEKGK